MGKLVYFVAGVSVDVLPAKHIKSVLLNVPDNGRDEKAIKDARNLVRISRAKTVMLDSGGFQLLQAEKRGLGIGYDETGAIRQEGKINLTPWHVVKAAMNLRPDIMVALDFPIDTFDDREKQEVEFRYKLGFNVDWSTQTAELRKKYCPDTILFVPVQCYNLEHFGIFTRLIQGIDFDGFSMPVRNLSLGEIILFLIRFRQMGIKKVHLLGTSTFFIIALSSFMAEHLFDWVSLDATTWRYIAQKETYLNPYDLSPEILTPQVQIDEAIPVDCKCPWCKGKTFTYIKNLPYTEKTNFLRCHNHWVIEKAVRELSQNSGTLEGLRRFLRKRSSNQKAAEELCRCLAVADEFKDLPVEQWKGILLNSRLTRNIE
jgi:tRNA-guanine family transglycosylase